jgi:predicted metalloprotease with PDZ domain
MSFTEMSAGIVDEPYQANYGNVYQKGALINMCLDILIREKSGGVHGILWVMKNLAKKYGKERPFKDEELIGEIVAMTYPEVGAFFEQHVIGTTPIDYDLYFSKVGLINGEVETPLRSIIFANNAELFFSPQPGAEDQMQFVVTQLNDSIEAMGVQQGDVLLGIDGALFPEINQENSGKINALLMPSLSWEADQEFSLTVERNGETLTLTGTVGTPTAVSKGLVENQDATAEAVSLREAWLFQ